MLNIIHLKEMNNSIGLFLIADEIIRLIVQF